MTWLRDFHSLEEHEVPLRTLSTYGISTGSTGERNQPRYNLRVTVLLPEYRTRPGISYWIGEIFRDELRSLMYSEEDNTPDISRGTGWIPDDFYNRICE